jgi:hypothetical protein
VHRIQLSDVFQMFAENVAISAQCLRYPDVTRCAKDHAKSLILHARSPD